MAWHLRDVMLVVCRSMRSQSLCRLIKDFEREARMEGMPVATLAARKKGLVQELNSFIAQKKAASEQADSIGELTQGTKKGPQSPKGRAGKPSFRIWESNSLSHRTWLQD